MKLEFSRHIFEKVSNITIHQNPSSKSRLVLCGHTDGPDITKKIVAFRNSAKAPKTSHLALYRQKAAICSEQHTKHRNTMCVQNV
jgi:hypothetical protein